METTPILEPRSSLAEQILDRVRDKGRRRWTLTEVYRSINVALDEWHGRAAVPFVYNLTGGWQPGVYEYPLPDYVDEPMVPQRRVLIPYDSTTGDTRQFVWADLLGWSVEPDGKGGKVLRTPFNEGVVGATNEGRILWWALPDRVPDEEENPTLAAALGASDTSLSLSSMPQEAVRVGYVRVDSEIIQYAGVSGSTLQNLVRGVQGTTAASHASGAEVEWMVPFTDPRLKDQLIQRALAELHAITLTGSPGQETGDHRWLMQWHMQQAQDFWTTWASPRRGRIRLDRRATGLW